jgi:aspartate/methionine/tyrosine aminotransferase
MTSRFDTSEYLSWYIPRAMAGDDAINLHSSGVPMVLPSELDIDDIEGNPFETPPRLERALSVWLGIEPGEIVFTPGGTGGTLLALLTLVEPGGNIVVEKPIYEPMLRQAAALGEVRRVERCFEDRWRLPLGEARRLIDDSTSVVMITEPHNPSSVLSPRNDIEEMARVAAEHGAILLINEVYGQFCEAPSYHGLAKNVVIVSSLSKLAGSYWARVGWLSSTKELSARFKTAHMNMGMPAALAAQAGLAFLKDIDRFRNRAIELSASGLKEVREMIESNSSLSWHEPDAAGFSCIKLPSGIDDLKFARKLHEDHGVLVVPGGCFETPGTVRLSWIQAKERLSEGLEIFSTVSSSMGPGTRTSPRRVV